MKKVVRLLIIILVFYLIFNYFLGQSNDLIQYKIKDFNIIENHENGTYFEINVNGLYFNFYSFEKIDKKAITDIKYYSDNDYKCIIPVFKNGKTYTDAICIKNGVQYLYSTMPNHSIELDNFRNEMISYDGLTNEPETNGMLTIYKDNLLKNKYLILNVYKGIYILTKDSQREIELFDNDVYNPTIKCLIDKYYVIADYNQNHDFNKFFIIDIESGKKSELKTKYEISLDSIIQGTYDNKLYLYDQDNKIQYSVDIKKMIVSIAGNEKKGIKIYDKELKTYKINEINDLKFKYDTYIDGYNLLGNVGNVNYYLLNNNVYKVNSNSKDKLTYLFSNQYESIKYSKDYLCMLKESTIYCYNELFGINKIATNKEFSFNKNLTYEVYSK